MPSVGEIADFLDCFAPPRLAEEWDNVGLLLGNRQTPAERVMTCLTVTGESTSEAIEQRADLIITHHPLPFRPLKRVTADTRDGRLLWELARHGIAIHSSHTAFDSARDGINARLAAGLGLANAEPLRVSEEGLGGGRHGELSSAVTLPVLAERVKQFLKVDQVQVVGSSDSTISRVAVACGSAGELLPCAVAAGCDCLVTGEMRFHACLEADGAGIRLIMAGHYASERFAVEALADVLAGQFPNLRIWTSHRERDPLRWI